MSLIPRTKVWHTLAFKLTIWYAGMVACLAVVAFFFFYFLIVTAMEKQVDQDLTSQAAGLSGLLSSRGIEAVQNAVVMESKAAGEKKIFFRLFSPSGQAFSSSNMAYWRHIQIDATAVQTLVSQQRRVLASVDVPGQGYRVRVLYDIIGPGIFIQLGQSMESLARLLETFGNMFVLTMTLLVMVAAGVGGVIARQALSGVGMVTRTARRISEGGDLSRRVLTAGHSDEIHQLAVTFNLMLDRIEALITGIRQMGDDIAHDLKSPITRIRGLAEVTLTTGSDMADYELMAADTIDACDRLLTMINTMLTISKTEAGAEPMTRETIDMAALMADACDLFEPVAEENGLSFFQEAYPSCRVLGDRGKLQRMMANLLDNAMNYTEVGGSVRVAMGCPDGEAGMDITITNSGPGIPPAELPRVFERFYRGDRSRSRTGAGLGLSLARAIARAHGGDITLTSDTVEGTTVCVDASDGADGGYPKMTD